jgi:flagellar hook-basal body complex protein FliE
MQTSGLNRIQNPAIEQLVRESVVPTGETTEKGGDFAQTLMDVLKDVNASQQEARDMQNDFMTGRRKVEIHDLMIAMERAGVAMNLTMAVRNKLMEAYQEINRIQV